jgi:tRNA pseudouridine38-40 synthase
VSRSYLYQIARRRTAFAKPFVWWIREPLDLNAMRHAAEAFVGRQDFAAFSDDDPDEKSTIVVLERLELVEAGALILVRVQGSHFLWKMVRRIVGVLAAVGRGEMKPADAAELLRGRSRSGGPTPAELTAPAAGLFLERVCYKGDPAPGPMRPVIAIE